MAPVSIDDLIASLKGNGIGSEASDLAAVKAHLSQTLGTNAAQNGYTPTHTSNTPQGTPVTQHPPMGAPWDPRGMSMSDRARRRRSQSRGFDMAIDEEDEAMAESSTSADKDRWRSPQRKAMHSPQESFSGHGFPPMSPISATAPPLSPPASPTRPMHHVPIPTSNSPYAHHPHAHHPHAHHHPHEGGYAAASDPFLQQAQQPQGAGFYGPFYPQSPPMDTCPPAMNMAGWNPAPQWPAGFAQPVPTREAGRR